MEFDFLGFSLSSSFARNLDERKNLLICANSLNVTICMLRHFLILNI